MSTGGTKNFFIREFFDITISILSIILAQALHLLENTAYLIQLEIFL